MRLTPQWAGTALAPSAAGRGGPPQAGTHNICRLASLPSSAGTSVPFSWLKDTFLGRSPPEGRRVRRGRRASGSAGDGGSWQQRAERRAQAVGGVRRERTAVSSCAARTATGAVRPACCRRRPFAGGEPRRQQLIQLGCPNASATIVWDAEVPGGVPGGARRQGGRAQYLQVSELRQHLRQRAGHPLAGNLSDAAEASSAGQRVRRARRRCRSTAFDVGFLAREAASAGAACTGGWSTAAQRAKAGQKQLGEGRGRGGGGGRTSA